MKMKKLTLLLFALACAMTTWAKGIDTLAVDLIYKELLANPKVTKTPVRYTGGWKQGIRGFAWQQGEGRGWTVGTRLALRNAKKADFDRFAKVFKDYNQYTMSAFTIIALTWDWNVARRSMVCTGMTVRSIS